MTAGQIVEYPEQTKIHNVLRYLQHAFTEARAHGLSSLPVEVITRGKKSGIYNAYKSEDISSQLGLSDGETMSWLSRLSDEGYIRMEKAPQ